MEVWEYRETEFPHLSRGFPPPPDDGNWTLHATEAREHSHSVAAIWKRDLWDLAGADMLRAEGLV